MTNWTIETIEKARAIYQAKHGGDYFENGEIFKRVTDALKEALQQSTEKDAPMTLTDLPRPWSTDEMKRIPYEVYKDFEQGLPFKDEQ